MTYADYINGTLPAQNANSGATAWQKLMLRAGLGQPGSTFGMLGMSGSMLDAPATAPQGGVTAPPNQWLTNSPPAGQNVGGQQVFGGPALGMPLPAPSQHPANKPWWWTPTPVQPPRAVRGLFGGQPTHSTVGQLGGAWGARQRPMMISLS